ncbi:MFS transporter [Plantactinospora sp. B6F1]|uniref:MFS transporter n=1 Tax=Plantactinospora sp. B6F1 TaxID=3158971 RepID=UPI00102BA435
MSFLRDIIPPAGLVRLLAISNLAKTTAHGIIMTISVLYFTRVVGIAPERVGLALTVGAGAGMLSSVPAGRLADVRGARGVTVTLLFVLGLVTCGYALVTNFVGLLLAAAVVLAIESGSNAARGGLLAALLAPEERVRAWAYMRSMANIGVSLGAVIGGSALLIDSRSAYVALLVAAGGLFVLSGLAFLRVPAVPATPTASDEDGGPKWVVLRDLPYAAVSLVNSVLVMSDALLIVAMPIWISQHTSAPPFFFTVLLLINTATVILFQVRASRGAEDVAGGVRIWRRASLAFALCCVIFALAKGQGVWLAAIILIAGTLAHVLGEMWHSAGAWSLSYGLARDGAQGQYQGLFETSTQLGSMVAPLAITGALAALGYGGWLVFAVVFLVAGSVVPPLTRWARRTRPVAAPGGSTSDPATGTPEPVPPAASPVAATDS